MKPKCLFAALFHGKARSGMQLPHTTAKGKIAGFIFPDLRISVPEICFLHLMLVAFGGSTLPPKAESCTCIARDKFWTVHKAEPNHMELDLFSAKATWSQIDLGQWWILLHLHVGSMAHAWAQEPGYIKGNSSILETFSSLVWMWRRLHVVLWVSLILWTLGDKFFFYIILNCPPLHT